MREIALDHKSVGSQPKTDIRHILMTALANVGRRDVYRTFWKIDAKEFVLTTTSRDIHLAIGTVGKKGLDALCSLIEAEHGHGEDNEFILNTDRRSVFILRSEEAGIIIFHLSPMQGNRHDGH
ncbi:MAG: hypothetical protein V4436_00590 [Patescibacteria group bacterium]